MRALGFVRSGTSFRSLVCVSALGLALGGCSADNGAGEQDASGDEATTPPTPDGSPPSEDAGFDARPGTDATLPEAGPGTDATLPDAGPGSDSTVAEAEADAAADSTLSDASGDSPFTEAGLAPDAKPGLEAGADTGTSHDAEAEAQGEVDASNAGADSGSDAGSSDAGAGGGSDTGTDAGTSDAALEKDAEAGAPCVLDSDCDQSILPAVWCKKTDGNCGGVGVCTVWPGYMTYPWSDTPVCGCNGANYFSPGDANYLRMNVASHGECPDAAPCSPTQPCQGTVAPFCRTPIGACGGVGICYSLSYGNCSFSNSQLACGCDGEQVPECAIYQFKHNMEAWWGPLPDGGLGCPPAEGDD
jgi:hypothetical protein